MLGTVTSGLQGNVLAQYLKSNIVVKTLEKHRYTANTSVITKNVELTKYRR